MRLNTDDAIASQTEAIEPHAIVANPNNIEVLEKFTVQELVTVESWLLQAVGWDVFHSQESAPVSFLEFLLQDEELALFQKKVLKAVLNFSYTSHQLCHFRSSVIAASIVTLASGFAMARDRCTISWKPPQSINEDVEWQRHRISCTNILKNNFLKATANATQVPTLDHPPHHAHPTIQCKPVMVAEK